MRIAIPLSNGLLALHFGHSERFAIVDVDLARKVVLQTTEVVAPEHMPGLLPRWLRGHGVNLVIAGGMGSRARALFEEALIKVVTGAPAREPDVLVRDYLDGTLATGPNECDH